MAFENENFNSLLSDEDVHVDEETTEDEVIEQDPLGLADFINQNNSEEKEESDKDSDNDSDQNESDDFVTSYLKQYGVSDPSKLQFEGENGEIVERDFNSLSNEEKLNVFKDLADPGYNDYEKQVIDFLRKNNTTLDDVIAYYQQKAIDDYLNENPDKVHQRVYSIDDYTDDELYLADLKNKYPEFTDEELTSKLDSAKLNEELFTKEVDAIRTSLKQREDDEIKQQEELEAQSFQELQTNLQNAMADFTEIMLDPEDNSQDALSLQIEDADRDVMMRYLLERDKDGKSQLVRDLEDPQALIELAYYRTRERDNLTGLTRYWKKVLADERKEKASLQKELDKYKNKENNSSVVTQPKSQSRKPSMKAKTVFDIYG